jgi:hypothetical protein
MHVKRILDFDVFLMSCSALEEHVTAIAVLPAAHAYLSAFRLTRDSSRQATSVRPLLSVVSVTCVVISFFLPDTCRETASCGERA